MEHNNHENHMHHNHHPHHAHKHAKLFAVKTIFTAIGIVMIWRGIWMLCDEYLFPEHPSASAIVSLIVGFAIIILDDLRIDELKR